LPNGGEVVNASCPDVLAPFLRPLEGVRSAGLEPTDEDFIAIVAAAEKTSWEDLEDRIRALDEDRMLDVRIFAFATYLAWRAGGFAALPYVYDGLARVAGPDLEAFGPARKKVAHLDVRGAWALATIADDIAYHQKQQTAEWAKWTKGVTRAIADRIGESRREAQRALDEAGATRAADALGRISGAVDKYVSAVIIDDETPKSVAKSRRAPLPEGPRSESAPEGVSGPYDDDAPASGGYLDIDDGHDEALPSGRGGAGSFGEPPRAPRPRARDLAASGSVVSLAVAPAFVELVRKLEAFESLIAQGKHQKAALVADDLTEMISRFDPRVYFPDLFSSFGKSLAENIEILGEHWESRESLSWKALEQFYRVDLKRFVDG
jgi:hypothetical protein